MSPRKVNQKTTVLVETVEEDEDSDAGRAEKEYTVSFKMTAKDHERLDSYAKEQRMSKSMIIRTAVNKYISQVDGLVEVKLPLADYRSLKKLLVKNQIISIDAAIAEAVRAYVVKKGEEFEMMQRIYGSLE